MNHVGSMRILVRLLSVVLLLSTVATAATTGQVWWTSLDGLTLMKRQADVTFDSSSRSYDHQINVDDAQLAQPFWGFGAAMSDTSAYLFNRMKQVNPVTYNQVLSNLFNSSGAGLNVVRVTTSASDFDLTPFWTLDDQSDDISLTHFTMAPLYRHIIPAIKDIQIIRPDIKIMLSPWSAPAWMKDSNNMTFGHLRDDMIDTYARYWVKMVDGFHDAGIPVHYITLQNEPHFEPRTYSGMRMEANQQATLIHRVGELLSNRSTKPKILAWDHNWDEGVAYINSVFSNRDSLKYTAGSAWHCYGGNVAEQSKIWNAFPDKEIHLTECSGGDWTGNWHDNLISNVQTLYMGAVWNGAQSVQHWNLALDTRKGPTTSPGGCKTCRGVITVGDDFTSVTYNVEYWGMSHFGRFLSSAAHSAAARHCHTSASGAAAGMSSVAYLIPKASITGGSNSVLLGVLNAGSSPVTMRIVNDNGEWASYTAQPGISSFIWKARNQSPFTS